jgi:hypothetical protein
MREHGFLLAESILNNLEWFKVFASVGISHKKPGAMPVTAPD